MEEGKRPGGLTVLAVFNFIFAGQTFLGFLMFAGLYAAAEAIGVTDEQWAEILEEMKKAGMTGNVLLALVIGGLVSAVTLLLSGIGYMKQKRGLGRGVGNLSALIGIVHTFVMMKVLPRELGGDLQLMVLVGLIYPALTLYFLNVTFKEDFIR